MLLNFSLRNFRSFRDKSTLSMIPVNIRDIPYSVLTEKISHQSYKALSSSILYGANASGKSNVILALDFLREIVIAGNIENQRSIPIQLIPGFYNDESDSIELSILFIHKKHCFYYQIEIGNAKFLSETSKPFVRKEILQIDNKLAFERIDKALHIPSQVIKRDQESLILNQAESSLLSNELFLSNGFKTLIDTDMYSIILHWFKECLVVVRKIDFISAAPTRYDYEKMGDATEDKFKLSSNIIDKIAKEAGINSTTIRYLKKDDDHGLQPFSIIDNKAVVARFVESEGTMKIINFVPLVIAVMAKGATLVIDEMDSSLHPSAVFSIINAFHNNELNVKKAQLIFTTHNPIYQKAKIFRRDEIKFIERNDRTSSIRALSDYGTSGTDGVKNSTDIMKNYLSGKYGAINYIDFSDAIAEALALNDCTGEE